MKEHTENKQQTSSKSTEYNKAYSENDEYVEITLEKVNDTPFWIRENPEDGMMYITILDGLATSKKFKTIEEAKKYIKERPWDLITSAITAIIIAKARLDIENQENK